MTRHLVTQALLPILMGLIAVAESATAATPVPIIFDTDMGNDVDDAMALALLHELADRGEVKVLAVTISKDNPWCAPYIDLVNTFYGRPDIPIGVVRGGKTPADGKFIRAVAERKNGDELAYPRDVRADNDLPEAVDLLRETLSRQPDGKTKLVSVGFLTNMSRLLESKPDAHSPLSGRELIQAKVAQYVAMAGAYSSERQPEYNVFVDAEASRTVFEAWPTPLVASGFEIGLAILYPSKSIEEDFSYVADHPIEEAYRLYVDMPHDRPTWDLTAVLYAARPRSGLFGLSYPGTISLNSKSVTEFAENSDGRHRYLTASPAQIIRVRELLVQMVSSPPGK